MAEKSASRVDERSRSTHGVDVGGRPAPRADAGAQSDEEADEAQRLAHVKRSGVAQDR